MRGRKGAQGERRRPRRAEVWPSSCPWEPFSSSPWCAFVLILRRTHPSLARPFRPPLSLAPFARPFRSPLGPLAPILGAVVCIYLLSGPWRPRLPYHGPTQSGPEAERHMPGRGMRTNG